MKFVSLVSVRIRDSTVAEPYSNISEELKPLNTKSTAEMDWKNRKMGSRNNWRGWRRCLCFFIITEKCHGVAVWVQKDEYNNEWNTDEVVGVGKEKVMLDEKELLNSLGQLSDLHRFMILPLDA